MNVGIIGYGRMGELYHQVIKEMKFDVDFICDLEKKIVGVKSFSDYKIALDSSEIDILIVSTYGPSHYEIMKYAIKKNIKYILCEKPFTTSLKHADEITELVKKSQSTLAISYLRRFSDAYTDLGIKLRNNKIIGDVKSIIITSGAGGISTLGTHFIDLCILLLDFSLVRSVYAIPINRNHPNPRGEEFEDPGGYFILNFNSGKRAFVDMSDDLGLQPRIEIIGSYGRIEIDEINKKIVGYSRKMSDRDKPMRFYGLDNELIIDESFGFESLNVLIKKMIQDMISDTKLQIIPNMVRNNVEIYSAIRKSFDSGKIISLPLEGEYYDREFMVT